MVSVQSGQRELGHRGEHDLGGLNGGGADVALHKGARDGATGDIASFLCVESSSEERR